MTRAAGLGVGLFVLRDMFAACVPGQWLLVPWFEVFGATVATIPESRRYLHARRRGDLEQISSWKEFVSSHPTMGTGRLGGESDDGSDDTSDQTR